LASTAGDNFRHLSSKTSRAWTVENIPIYTVLLTALLSTVVDILNGAVGKDYSLFASVAFKIQGLYGFWIGAVCQEF